MFKSREDLANPKLRNKIVSLRREGIGWNKIVETIYKDFGVKVTSPTVRIIFDREMAKTLKSPKVRDQFKADYQIIHERWTKAQGLLEKLEESFNKIYEKYRDQPEIIFLKMGPTLLGLVREITNQLEFIKKEQERITIQQKNLYFTPIQINMQIHKHLKEYQEQGYIRILKKLPIEEESEDEEENDISESPKQKSRKRV